MTTKNLSREDLLSLLTSMGAILPENTKLPEEDLRKRFAHALDASQQLATLIEATPVDPDLLPKWSSDKTLFEASQRGNISEAMDGSMSQAKKGARAPKEDIFKEMRQSVLGFAYMYDQDLREVCYTDENERWGIFVRLLDVHKIKNDVPLFLFTYKELVPTGAQTLESLFNMFRVEGDRATVNISDLERRALLMLFQRNAKKLHPRYQAINEEGEAKKLGLHASFVLPLCPLGMRELGKITHNAGCDVCGKKNTSRCKQCLSANYCGKECQQQDWKTHKLTCRSLKGGSWDTITTCGLPSFLPHSSMINRLDTLNHPPSSKVSDGKPPADIHNGKVFLAKFQISLAGMSGGAHIMIYDRQRSFQLFWLRASNVALFERAKAMMGHKLKFYRWIRRVGDYGMDVCFDRAPEADPLW
ncbi:hypothetical protein NLJ89_g1592 [Agrocybe chaxingu]|uniref:MYND-type domain-containing protein n=1 Tax=Agrocybe chaxingu TaxID=84603 RepID=A0A9W8MZQ2_9AGAR|nr:hypothetical protein NLJ89_g1592 [Agrocybe chaxingu]